MPRNTTRTLLLTTLVLGLAVSLGGAADAKSKKRKAVARSAPAAQPMSGFHQQPARMIEVQPGLWVSSYGCVTDDGYGRRLPCDVTDSSGR